MITVRFLQFLGALFVAIIAIFLLFGLSDLIKRMLGILMNRLGLGIDDKEMHDRLLLRDENPDFREIRSREYRNSMKVRHYSTTDDSYKRRK